MSAISHQQPVRVLPPSLRPMLFYFVLAKGEGEDDAYNIDEIVSRTAFQDSWLWTDRQLPGCPTGQPNW